MARISENEASQLDRCTRENSLKKQQLDAWQQEKHSLWSQRDCKAMDFGYCRRRCGRRGT